VPDFLLHQGAGVQCSHAGRAEPFVANPRVRVAGRETVLLLTPYKITGCTLPPPPSANGPCVVALFTSSATRVFSNGFPLLLRNSQATCAPSGTPLKIGTTQTRVRGA
jgi:hypothetical protein